MTLKGIKIINETKPRARDLGIPFEGKPGALNAITDIEGVEVGHCTLISNEGKLKTGKGVARTGVTAIFPIGKKAHEGVTAACFVLNGAGEMTGTKIVDEFGGFLGPIMLTNTISVGTVRDAVIRWLMKYIDDEMVLFAQSVPIVAETFDGNLNDAYGFHIKDEHVFQALDGAKEGDVEEGNVGGGTGITSYTFKGGIGTSSRIVEYDGKEYTIGVLVQANHGSRENLRIAGVPVGQEITDLTPELESSATNEAKPGSSIIIIVGTNAPFLPYQLKRIAKRAALGLARNGSIAGSMSGDIILAFSTVNRINIYQEGIGAYSFISDINQISPFFVATVQATEEAIINALVAAKTMVGANGIKFYALPHDRLKEAMKKYNRLKN